MLKSTEAIVLKNQVYGEADLIVTYLSADYGIIHTLAKSPRKIKSRFGSSLEPLTHSHIAFWGKEQTSLPRLTRSDIINPFYALRDDIHLFTELAEILRLNLCLIQDRSPVKELFFLLKDTLTNLQRGCDSKIGLLYYRIKFLESTGHLPNLETCGRCGALATSIQRDRSFQSFYINHGTILCVNCHSNGDSVLSISNHALKLYSSIKHWDIHKLQRIKAPQGLIDELLTILNAHIEFNLTV